MKQTDMDASSENVFCFSLPKIELHAHLNGSLSDKILPLLGCNNTDLNEYQKLKNIPIGKRNLEDAFKIFSIAHRATSSPEAVYTAAKEVIREFAQENVIYLELRTTPRSEIGMSAESYVECVVKAIKETENDIMVKLILSLNRQHSLEVCETNLDLILKMKAKYPDIIKGIDLSGNPSHGSFKDLKFFFEKAKESGLLTTIHCGEIANTGEVEEILEFKPDRIGHACFIHPNYNGCIENWRLLKELKIPTEFCLTSNVVTGTVDVYENHHVQEWLKDDLPFSINTDDKGVFDTSLSEEYQHAMKFLKLSCADLWGISIKSIEYSFANDDEKLLLKKKMEDWKNKNQHFFTS